MAAHEEDRGMFAVRRVRSVRETDSRIGLQQAVAERRAAGARVNDLRQRLTRAGRAEETAAATSAFLASRASLLALSDTLRAAERSWEVSRTVTDAAQEQWRQDRARLAAIDLLLERRAEERRAEGLRREARELDEFASQRWLRDRDGAR